MIHLRNTALGRRDTAFTLLAVSMFAALTAAPLQAVSPDEPIRALQRNPHLADFFAYGFWHGQAPHDERLAGEFHEPTYESRRHKVLHHFARNHINIYVTANRMATEESLAAAGKYGIRQISSAQFLLGHVKHSGDLQGDLTMEQVLQQIRKHVESVKDSPHLLGCLLYDEPGAKVAPFIRQVADAVRPADSKHPPIYTHSETPLDRLGHPYEWELVRSQDILLSDSYTITTRSGRDPWLYGDVIVPELRRANPDALQCPIIQAFMYLALPTVPELRVQVYHTIAAGAKGMFCFTSNQAYFGAWASDHWYYRGVGNPWLGREELMQEIGRIGEHLTTVGPLLIPLRYAPNYPAYVGAVDAPADPPQMFQAYVLGTESNVGRALGLRHSGELQRPAVHVGAFSGVDYDVLVIHNNDPWRTRRAAVTVATRHEKVLDLATLETVSLDHTAGGVTFPVSFKPGDGRLYLVGDNAAVDAARRQVRRKRYAHQARQLRPDAEITGRGGVDIRTFEQTLEQAAAADDPATSLLRLADARTAPKTLSGHSPKSARILRRPDVVSMRSTTGSTAPRSGPANRTLVRNWADLAIL